MVGETCPLLLEMMCFRLGIFSALLHTVAATPADLQTRCPETLRGGNFATITCTVNAGALKTAQCGFLKQIIFELSDGSKESGLCSADYPPTDCQTPVQNGSCGCVSNKDVDGWRTYEFQYRWLVDLKSPRGRMRCNTCYNNKGPLRRAEEVNCRWGLWPDAAVSTPDAAIFTQCPEELKGGNYAPITCDVDASSLLSAKCEYAKKLVFGLNNGTKGTGLCATDYPPKDCQVLVQDGKCACVSEKLVKGRRTFEFQYKWLVDLSNKRGRVRCNTCFGNKGPLLRAEAATCRWGGGWPADDIPVDNDLSDDQGSSNDTDSNNDDNDNNSDNSLNIEDDSIKEKTLIIIIVSLVGGVLLLIALALVGFYCRKRIIAASGDDDDVDNLDDVNGIGRHFDTENFPEVDEDGRKMADTSSEYSESKLTSSVSRSGPVPVAELMVEVKNKFIPFPADPSATEEGTEGSLDSSSADNETRV